MLLTFTFTFTFMATPVLSQTMSEIAGTVRDSGGTPIGAATVRVSGRSTTTTATEADGTFRVPLSPGVYTITVSKPGFQSVAYDDIAVAAQPVRLAVALIESTATTTLRTIGRITAKTGAQSLNTATSSVSILSGAAVRERALPDLNALVTEIPGVSIQRGGNSPNADFVVRGALQEANTAIDGHIIRSGNFGAFLTTYVNAQTFGSVEVTKGPGQFGPNSSNSVFGTVNLRTPDFAPGRYFETSQGIETRFGAPYSDYLANFHLLRDDRLDVLLSYHVNGSPRVGDGTTQYRPVASTGGPLIAFGDDFSSRLLQRSEVGKVRYKFNPSTSLTFAFIGLQGSVLAQSASQSNYLGQQTIAPCVPGASGACDLFAAYNPPYAQGLIGSTIGQYSFFPNAFITDNEPQFEAEFRTTVGNDTLLIRPSAALTNRTIDGNGEAAVPGQAIAGGSNGVASGAWFLVTNPANCQATFVAPNATKRTGAQGPCFQGTSRAPYIGPNAPCSVANPCYASTTTTNAAGQTVYASPFTQTQVDRDRDVTVTYIHPFGNGNSLTFAYDYNSNVNTNLSGDFSALSLSGSALTLANTPVSYPTATARRNDFSLSALLAPTPKLQISAAGYLTGATLGFFIVDPAQVAALTAAGTTGNILAKIPAATGYVGRTLSVRHFDPQIGFTYRPSNDVSLRASGGASTFVPYAGQLGGKPSFSNPSPASGNLFTVSLPNPALKPETTVGFDVGGDVRTPAGLISTDLFTNTIHDRFAGNRYTTTNSPFPIPGQTSVLVSQTVNLPIQRTYGLEFSLDGTRPFGFGYKANVTLQRAYYDQIPTSFYQFQSSQLANGVELTNNAPYSQGYAEVRYATRNNALITFGATYTGVPNAAGGPGYTLFNTTLRFPISGQNRLVAQIAVDNLSNYSQNTFAGALPNGTGFSRPQFGLVNGQVAQNGAQQLGLLYMPPRTIRAQLTAHVGNL